MTPLLLQDAICDFLKGVVGSYLLETNKQSQKAPQVVPSYLPLKGTAEVEDFPFVVVRLSSEEDTQERAKVMVKIIVGVYAEDIVQGSGDLMNLLERIRQALFKTRVIAKKFRIEYPFNWEVPDEQPYPEWVAVITTNWTVPRPIEEVDYGQGIYGETDAGQN